jgi:hypothetical protein
MRGWRLRRQSGGQAQRGYRSAGDDAAKHFSDFHRNLLQNSIEIAISVRARLQSCRKSNKKTLGFSPCCIYIQLFTTPQRLKPDSFLAMIGTTEVVP